MILPLLIVVLSAPVAAGPQESGVRVDAMIRALGDPEVGIRNAAQQALQRILPLAEKALRDNQGHPDAEIAWRCQELLRSLDQRRFEERRKYSGKVALVDPKGNRIAIDARLRDGAKVGDRLQVWRDGAKVGVLVILDVQVWGSWVKPEDGSTESFEKADGFERLPIVTGR
jgi:hypothetical protein